MSLVADDPWRRQRWFVTAAAVIAAVLVASLIAIMESTSGPGKSAAPPPQTVLPGTPLFEEPCAVGASGPFVPTSLAIPGVIRPSTVLALARNGYGVPDVPPLTETGKHEFAWDKGPVGILPGSSRGNALFNAHTWPWWLAPAYGNLMLKGLHKGGTIVLKGAGVTQCYRVTKRVEVPADGRYPGFYDRTGRPQIAIIVCSGVRAGPGDWLSRTIWFASPYTSDSSTI